MSAVSILLPITITDAMLNSGSTTIPEPDSSVGEVAWISGHQYFEGDTVVRVATHKVYYCQKDMGVSGRTVVPESDPTYWQAIRPTNRWAPLDTTTNSQSVATGASTWVFQPGFFNAICVYGLLGATMTVTVKDAPGGTAIYGPTTFNIQEVPFDEYDYCWGQIDQLDRLVISGITPFPSAEVTISIAAGGGAPVGAGIFALGDLVSTVPQDGTWAGPDADAQAEPTSFSEITNMIDGTVQIVNRRSAVNLTLRQHLPDKDAADICKRILSRVMDQPAAVIGSSGIDGLNAFGLVSGKVTYADGAPYADINVRGTV